MTFFQIFSKRQKEYPEFFSYDKLPKDLSRQLAHLIMQATGRWIRGTVATEKGEVVTKMNNEALFKLYHPIEIKLYNEYNFSRINYYHNAMSKVLDLIAYEKKLDRVLDVAEIMLRTINTKCREQQYRKAVKETLELEPDEAIEEFNFRLRYHGVGYQFESNQLIKLSSTISHGELIVPALRLLSNEMFRGSNEEFMSAHAHYRNRRFKECLADCSKAFESSLKIVCDSKGWNYLPTDTAKKLIKIIVDNQLIPSFTNSHFDSYEALLGTGVTTIRNKMAGHGQGSNPIVVHEEIAKYALNLTASNILFIIESARIKH